MQAEGKTKNAPTVKELLKSRKIGQNGDLKASNQKQELVSKLLTEKIKEKEEQDKVLTDLSLRHELVSSLLAAKVQNKGVAMFRETLNGDYMEFANADDTLANEAEVLLQLQNIEKELSIIAACPELYQKNIIAVGGGFSAGKSEFISSFMDSGIKLPISIEPTTAIPAYVMNAPKEYLLGYSKNGGAVDLRKIDKNFHARLNHDFMKGFKFNLKEILPFIVLGTKLKFENICFIDTPGYNPSGNIANYGADIDTAKEFLEEAGVFLWLVGLDSTGTMPSGDLEFLSSLDLENKKLYVVINKADLRAPSDLEAITETVRQNLDNYGINYEGIQTFSSVRTLENHCIVGKSLDEFLTECDTPSQKHVEIFNKLKNIYQAYKEAIKNSIKYKNSIKKTLHSIRMDILEEGGLDDVDSKILKLKNKSYFSTEKEEKNLKFLEIVMDKFKEAVKVVFEIKDVRVDFNEIDINQQQKDEILSMLKNTITDLKKERNVLAVCGLEYAGKTSFINSLIMSNFKIPMYDENINKDEMYIIDSEYERIISHSYCGKTIDMQPYDQNYHLKLYYEDIRDKLDNIVNIKAFSLMQSKLKYKNICFIDIPNWVIDDLDYNPFSNVDGLILISSADNITITNKELDFLENVEVEKSKIFVVINKGDKKEFNNEIKSIHSNYINTIWGRNMNIAGVQTYSSINSHSGWYWTNHQQINEFLDKMNTICDAHNIYDTFLQQLQFLYQSYKNAILKQPKNIKASLGKFNYRGVYYSDFTNSLNMYINRVIPDNTKNRRLLFISRFVSKMALSDIENKDIQDFVYNLYKVSKKSKIMRLKTFIKKQIYEFNVFKECVFDIAEKLSKDIKEDFGRDMYNEFLEQLEEGCRSYLNYLSSQVG